MLVFDPAMQAMLRNTLQGTVGHSIEKISGLTFEQLKAEAEKTRMRRLPLRPPQHELSKLRIEQDIQGQFWGDCKEFTLFQTLS